MLSMSLRAMPRSSSLSSQMSTSASSSASCAPIRRRGSAATDMRANRWPCRGARRAEDVHPAAVCTMTNSCRRRQNAKSGHLRHVLASSIDDEGSTLAVVAIPLASVCGSFSAYERGRRSLRDRSYIDSTKSANNLLFSSAPISAGRLVFLARQTSIDVRALRYSLLPEACARS